jgi:hypothetical protein
MVVPPLLLLAVVEVLVVTESLGSIMVLVSGRGMQKSIYENQILKII